MRKLFLLLMLAGAAFGQNFYTRCDTLKVTSTEVDTTLQYAYMQALFMAIDCDVFVKVSSDTSLQGQEWVKIPENSGLIFGPVNIVNRYAAKTASGDSGTLQVLGYRKTKPY
jgi:hypothetical protein